MVEQFRPRWWRSRTPLEIACIAGGAVLVAVQWVVIARRRALHIGDFDVAREFGRRFLAHEYLYGGGQDYPYMPAAAMYASPFALVDAEVGLALRYAVAVLCLLLTLRLLHEMLRRRSPRIAAQGLTIGALTVLLALHYVIRDLDDGGPHLILLAMLVGGIYRASQGKEYRAAIWFGLAAALKGPAALFLPFFLLQRRWRLAGATALAVLSWTALPAVWMGPASWWQHQYEWTRVAWGSATGNLSPVARESESRVQNQALRPVLVRGLDKVVDAATANAMAAAAIAALAASSAWWLRGRGGGTAHAAWPLSCSAVLILTLLLSPVTWVQHIVLILPALYIVVAEDRGIRRLGAPATAAMVVYVVLSLLLNREVLGKERYLLLLSGGTHTVCMLLVLGVVMLRRPTAPAVECVNAPQAPA